MKRPISVSIIAWILIVSNGVALISGILHLNDPMMNEMMARNPMPIGFQYLILYGNLSSLIIAAIAMLKGVKWGRTLYVVCKCFGFYISLVTSQVTTIMIPGFIVFGVFVFFLFRPNVNKYFSQLDPKIDAQNI